ncbi:hypothetical protein ALC62_10604, partial [Cyphomyrmex costatus]
EEGGGKKKTPPREGRGAHSRRHPFAKLLTTGNASGAERKKEGKKEKRKERTRAREQQHRNKNKLLFQKKEENGERRQRRRSLAVGGSTFPGRKRIVKSNTESNRVESEGPRENAGCWPLHLAYMYVLCQRKKITKYGTLLPEFIVRHFAARLVVLVGAANPVEEGDEEEEEEDCVKIGGEKERLEN